MSRPTAIMGDVKVLPHPAFYPLRRLNEDSDGIIIESIYVPVIIIVSSGVVLGICVSVFRCWTYHRNQVETTATTTVDDDIQDIDQLGIDQLGPQQALRLTADWSCVRLSWCCASCLSCCGRCMRRSSARLQRMPSKVGNISHGSPAGMSVLMSFTILSSVVALVMAVFLRVRLGELHVNAVGDPERQFVDDCMRDFENLALDSDEYKRHRRDCVDDLTKDKRFQRLPQLRLTVDERVCDPANLCGSSDPGNCLDKGEIGSSDYKAGDVSHCYDLIARSKLERNYHQQLALWDQVEQTCTGASVWKDHEQRTQLDYCMWKHMSSGLCMNSVRTNCPKDDSCCPVAQSAPDTISGDRLKRPDEYICQKSPIVGLFCQHRNFRAEGNGTGDQLPLCTEELCSPFAWCRDFADVPGLCMSPPCKDYQRSLVTTAVIIGLTVFALVTDLVDVVLLLRCMSVRTSSKAVVNFSGGFIKFGTFALFVAGGIQEFTEAIVSYQCFNEKGQKYVSDTQTYVSAFQAMMLLSAVGSLCIAPLSSARASSYIVPRL